MKFNPTPTELVKAISTRPGSEFYGEDITSTITRKQLKPNLLTAMINPQVELLMTDTMKFVKTNASVSLPGSKAFSEDGDYVKKDKDQSFFYQVSSRGLVGTVSPQDYVNRMSISNPGQLMQEEEVLARLMPKIMDGWALHEELDLISVITTDKNRVIDPQRDTQYDYHAEIEGAARGTATNVDFSATDAKVFGVLRDERAKAAQALSQAGLSARGFMVIAGDNFFRSLEDVNLQSGLGRDLRRPMDIASQSMPLLADGDYGYIENFESKEGMWIINYGATIVAGNKVVEDDKAFIVPMGVEGLIKKAYAPAVTREHCNREALPMYAWTHEDFRQGVSTVTESNSLTVLTTPKAIRHLAGTNNR